MIDDRHLGLQCHIEMTRTLVETWIGSGAREFPARRRPACNARPTSANVDAHLAELHAVAGDVYARWVQRLAR